MSDPQAGLKAFEPQHKFLVGIDSDGCTFDTMEIKHKECFCPTTVEQWGLQSVSKYVREAFQFVNLYSKWRGINRWPAVKMTLDLVRERPEVQALGVKVTEAKTLQAFIDSGYKTSDAGLWQYICQEAHSECPEVQAELQTMYRWTTGINARVARMVHGVKPFPYVRESLEKLSDSADMLCVSATPSEALGREWEEHDIAKYVALICGQDQGKKAEHLCLANGGQVDGAGGVTELGTRYTETHILMIGDAPGDMKAARANNALFYPINPGDEAGSWKRFYEEGVDKFLNEEYAGAYEAELIAEYETYLPDTPPWKL